MRKCTILLALVLLLPNTMAAGENFTSLSYLFGGTTSIYINNVNRTNGNLDIVSPDYFSLNSSGGLQLTRTPDPFFIESMHKQGIKVHPFLSNHWDSKTARLALTQIETIATQLADYITQYGMDGLDVDFQNLNENDCEAFTAFLRVLRKKLPASVTLSVCVAANPYGWTTGWRGQYDYASLAETVDYIFIMTYDESYETGSAGPVASLDYIEKSIKYALKYAPPEKFMIGVPFYGRYWKEGEGGKALTNSDIQALTARYGAKVWHDEKNVCARATMTITEADIAEGLWGGKKLSAGTYDIWYEDNISLEKKIALVKKYNLRGVGSWALGQEPAEIWTHYRKWLYGLAFADIGKHWAETAISELKNLGLVTGKPDGLFHPNSHMTRAEACVMLCRMLDLQPLSGQAVPDIVKGHWAAGYLAKALEAGFIVGYPDGAIHPDRAISRAEMASIAASVLHVPETINYQQQVFSDITVSHWANNDIMTLYVYGAVKGMPDGSYKPENNLTRAEGSTIIYGIIGLPHKNFVRYGETTLEPR